MAGAKQGFGLQIIFSIFLGLMVAAFIGVGVYTFYPPPQQALQDKIEELNRQQEQLQSFKDPSTLDAADKRELREIQDEIRDLEKQMQAAREEWGRWTSIILIAFATLAMSISLIRADQLPVISNGLLLGGVFTMIYGVGWIIATGTSIARFAVMTIALIITIGLGYMRFVRVREAAEPVAVASGAEGTVVGGDVLVARMDALERRLDAASAALSEHKRD